MFKSRKNYNLSFGLIIITSVISLIIMFLAPGLGGYLGLNLYNFFEFKLFWTPVTYMFVHSGIMHLFFNMFALFIFGHSIEERIGSFNFLTYYLVTGALAGIFSLLIYYLTGFNSFLIGASGAIYGVLFAYAVLFPNRKLYLMGLIPIIPPVLIGLYTLYDIYSQLFRATNIAHLTHLSGFLFGFLYFKFIFRINPLYIFKNYRRFK